MFPGRCKSQSQAPKRLPWLLFRTFLALLSSLALRLLTGTGTDSHQLLSDFSHFMSTGPHDKHLGQAFCNLWFVAAVLLKGLRVELALAISRHSEVFDAES
jgi:hypothetical protein